MRTYVRETLLKRISTDTPKKWSGKQKKAAQFFVFSLKNILRHKKYAFV